MAMPSWNNSSITPNSTTKSHLERCYFTDSVAVEICKVLAYCTVLLLGWVGNALLVIIVCKRKELKRTVNYLIVNMAISDIVFSLAGIPIKLNEMTSGSFHWQVEGVMGTMLCKMYRFSFLASLTVSLQSLAWISIDRFIAVVFPMKVKMISSKYRAFTIAFTWVSAIAVHSPYLIIMDLGKYRNRTYCGKWNVNSVFSNKTTFGIYNLATGATCLVAPLVLMTILYLIIAVTLKLRSKHLARISPHIQLQAHGKNARAMKMALCIMSVYGICFIPYLIWSYQLPYGTLSCSLQNALFFFVVILLYSSSTVNSIICFAFVRSFRSGLREIFNCCFKKGEVYNSDINNKNSQREIALKSVKIIT